MFKEAFDKISMSYENRELYRFRLIYLNIIKDERSKLDKNEEVNETLILACTQVLKSLPKPLIKVKSKEMPTQDLLLTSQ